MLFGILLTAQVIICAAMGGLILIQRSEGGALGMGGGPSGFMSARGAGNLLTKLTWVFAALLFANSVAMTVIGNIETHGTSAVDQVDTSKLTQTPVLPNASTAAPAASSSSSSGPSLNDLPIAGAPQATPQAAAPQASGPQAGNALLNAPASHTAPARMPAPLNVPAAGPAKLPAPLGATGASTSKTSRSASNIFQSSSSPTVKPPAASSSSSPALLPSSSSPTPAPASPSSSQ